MKKQILLVLAAILAVMSTSAQVKIESPHPDLDIKIKRCAYASGTVVVDMILTNFGQEEEITFYGSGTNTPTTAFDDDGNQYTGGNSKISTGLTSLGLSNGSSRVLLPQDIPMKFRIEIQKVNANATKLSLLKIAVFSKGAMALKEEKPLQFRNLEWAK